RFSRDWSSDVCSSDLTHDRPDLLKRALASLVALDPPAGEVLIVDNAPSDRRTHDLVAHEFPGVRYVREDVAGLDFARNRALTEEIGRASCRGERGNTS